MTTNPGDTTVDPIEAVHEAIRSYRRSRQQRDEAIIAAAITVGRQTAAEASGLSMSRINQLVNNRGRRTTEPTL